MGPRPVSPLLRGSTFEVEFCSFEGQPSVRKRVARHLASHPQALRALERERDILQRAGGQHLPVLLGFGDDTRGAYLVETVAPGHALRVFMDSAPLERNAWRAIARGSSRALAQFHGASEGGEPLELVHGDLSPSNVFVAHADAAPGFTVTFIDLAGATFSHGRAPVFPRNRGTLPYVAPELLRGEQGVDRATDVYALAAVLFFLAIGPHSPAPEPFVLEHLGSQGLPGAAIEKRPDLPAACRRAVARALAFDRAGRLSDAAELAEELARE